MYVYIKSEPGIYTVGFYGPNGRFNSESDWSSEEQARKQVHYMNGGNHEPAGKALSSQDIEDILNNYEQAINVCGNKKSTYDKGYLHAIVDVRKSIRQLVSRS